MVFTFVIIRHAVVICIESSQRNVSPRNGHGTLHYGMCGGHGAILRNEEYDGTSIVQW